MTKREFSDMVAAANEPISGGARRICALHWTQGGTGITNFERKDESLFTEALRRTGDEFLVIHSKPLGGSLSDCMSLHDTFPLRRDLGGFWRNYEAVRAEMKEGTK